MTIGYIYQTQQQAEQAINDCNVYYGIPASADDVTLNVCSYLYSEGNNFYYIIYDPILEVVLGEPENFEIIYVSGTTENV